MGQDQIGFEKKIFELTPVFQNGRIYDIIKIIFNKISYMIIIQSEQMYQLNLKRYFELYLY